MSPAQPVGHRRGSVMSRWRIGRQARLINLAAKARQPTVSPRCAWSVLPSRQKFPAPTLRRPQGAARGEPPATSTIAKGDQREQGRALDRQSPPPAAKKYGLRASVTPASAPHQGALTTPIASGPTPAPIRGQGKSPRANPQETAPGPPHLPACGWLRSKRLATDRE